MNNKKYDHIIPKYLLNGFNKEFCENKNSKNIKIKITTIQDEETKNSFEACGENYFYKRYELDNQLDNIITDIEKIQLKLNKFRKNDYFFTSKKYEIVDQYNKNNQPYDYLSKDDLHFYFKYIILSSVRTKATLELFQSIDKIIQDESKTFNFYSEYKKNIHRLSNPKYIYELTKFKNKKEKDYFYRNHKSIIKNLQINIEKNINLIKQEINKLESLLNNFELNKTIYNNFLFKFLNKIDEIDEFSLLKDKSFYLIKTENDIILPDTIVLILDENNNPQIFIDKYTNKIILPITYNKYIMITSSAEILTETYLLKLLAENSVQFFISRTDYDSIELQKYIGTNKKNYKALTHIE